MGSMVRKPVSERLHQGTAYLGIALCKQFLHLMHRIEYSIMLLNVTVTRWKLGIAHPSVFLAEMCLKMYFHRA